MAKGKKDDPKKDKEDKKDGKKGGLMKCPHCGEKMRKGGKCPSCGKKY